MDVSEAKKNVSEVKKDVSKDEDDWSEKSYFPPGWNIDDYVYAQNQYERDLDEQIAKILDEAGIPSVLFAEELLDIYGVPTVTYGSTWVIADDLIEKAYEALRDAEIPLCAKGVDCDQVRPDRWAPYSDLHKKSAIFWRMPDPQLEPPAPDDPNYMLVTDTRIPKWWLGTGAGRFKPGSHPKNIPTPARYAEAMFYLVCRDMKGHGHSDYWETQLNYMVSIHEDPKNDVFRISDVAQPARRYLEFYEEGGVPFKDKWRYMERVRAELIERNELPPLPGCGKSDRKS
ncbi:hypothetical protein PHISCL_08724 [Aspergillus sclerotialis]|uniref:Uncharacterized protein n=1 Tax=Aspergillus sclerotialis TaxID=2070753 RepID=A0A3A2ZCA7_9EURO|nr:hypothetical protein PHISCL_08724 [Aspergillus sclerotialis]